MKRFLLDTVLCCFFIFGIVGLFSSVTYFKVFELFDPIGDMFEDFEITDLVMSQLRGPFPADEDIVVVNIAYSNREEIAVMINILQQYNPAVIGVDVTFNARKPYAKDSLFHHVLKKYNNVVLGSELKMYNESTDQFDTLLLPVNYLRENADFGFVNLITGAISQKDLKSCRSFATRQHVKGSQEVQHAFPVKLAEYKDSVKTKNFLDRGNEVEFINYKGNIMTFSQSDYGARYFVLDKPDVFNENFIPDVIKDKVVIMCFLGKYIGDENTRRDIFFTPLNKRYVGKAEPDMFGGVVHANVVSMILEEDYVSTMSKTAELAFAVFCCLFNVFLFKIVYGALPRWYDGITKVFQLFQVLFLVFMMIWLFSAFTFKANFSYALVVIALSGDSIEVYHGVVKNLFSSTHRKKLFQINKRFLLDQ
ncbi:MAG TPA: CHASE2 domain-containing protein [Cyclobacteriaceae bacterium]